MLYGSLPHISPSPPVFYCSFLLSLVKEDGEAVALVSEKIIFQIYMWQKGVHISFSYSIVASIPACHAGDPGSIPGGRVLFAIFFHSLPLLPSASSTLSPLSLLESSSSASPPSPKRHRSDSAISLRNTSTTFSSLGQFGRNGGWKIYAHIFPPDRLFISLAVGSGSPASLSLQRVGNGGSSLISSTS